MPMSVHRFVLAGKELDQLVPDINMRHDVRVLPMSRGPARASVQDRGSSWPPMTAAPRQPPSLTAVGRALSSRQSRGG